MAFVDLKDVLEINKHSADHKERNLTGSALACGNDFTSVCDPVTITTKTGRIVAIGNCSMSTGSKTGQLYINAYKQDNTRIQIAYGCTNGVGSSMMIVIHGSLIDQIEPGETLTVKLEARHQDGTNSCFVDTYRPVQLTVFDV